MARSADAGQGTTAEVPDGVDELVRRYPPNTTASPATADAALADVARERAAINARHARDEKACMPAFMTTRCLDKARERRRVALAKLRPVEIEANAFRRREKVLERDRLLDEKRLKAEREAMPEQRSLNVPDAARPGGAPRAADGTARPAAPASVPHPRMPGVAKPDMPSIDATTEARNAAAYDRKAAESKARQHDVAARKLEKENERARKKAEAAAAATGPATR